MATMTNDMATFGSTAIVEAETYEPAIAPRVVSLSQPNHPAAEQYRVLRYRLECLAKAGIKALAFTSAQSGEGKTTTAVNAALALGKGGRNRVVLVDADLRRPGVASMLGLRANKGLTDIVAGRASLDDCLWRFGADELYVLPAGTPPDDLSATLYDPRMGDLMATLKQRFDFVIVDTPPVLPLADVPTLSRDLDGAIMVVRANHTPKELVNSALDALYGVTVHGLVLNEVDPRVASMLRIAPYGTQQKALPAKR
ncbi:MAG TPA: CpsD/CapB family tyrosine-protein kinase [Polyangia bacterium]